ncbi:MAG: hypothetical protein NW206_04415 [Hyphomonadaceae bacterium]|nr:hypothetical protein [Hyphomonadaceae bacterium]
MTKPNPPRAGGAAPMLTLLSAVILALGLGFDFGLNHSRASWIGAEPGARALIASAAVIVVVAAARLLRLALGRSEHGGGHGRD